MTKWFCIATVFAAALFDVASSNRGLLNSVVFAGSIVVATQAFRAREALWTLAFLVLALIFNPFLQVAISPAVLLGLEVVCILCFLASLLFLRSPRYLSAPSITERGRRATW
jgi:hypothetical protein